MIRVLADVAAGASALVFLAAALGKLDSWRQWSRLCEEIPGPGVLGRVVRIMVPALEGIIVVLSFAFPIVGLAAAALALTGFGLAVLLLARRLEGHECNCFGAIAPGTISQRLAARNVTLAGVGGVSWYAARDRTTTPPSPAQHHHDPGGHKRSHYVTITPGPSSPKFHGERGNLHGRCRGAQKPSPPRPLRLCSSRH